MKSIILSVISSICIIMFLIRCDGVNRKSKAVLREKYGKTIDLIDTLRYYKLGEGWISKPVLADLKIVTYINAGCSDCLYELQSWKSILNELKGQNISILIYIRTIDLNKLDSFLSSIDFPFPVIIDYNDCFFKSNKLIGNKLYQTFLLDAKNKIILIGNPLYGTKIRDLYIATIHKKTMPI